MEGLGRMCLACCECIQLLNTIRYRTLNLKPLVGREYRRKSLHLLKFAPDL